MTIKEWTQLAFALSNGLSFALTFRPSWRAKVAGSAVLCIAHPGVAVYFALTGQPIFLLGNAIMTGAGIYGIVRGLRQRRAAQAMAEAWKALAADAPICVEPNCCDWPDGHTGKPCPERDCSSGELLGIETLDERS